MAPLILNPGTWWKWVVNFKPWLPCPEKNSGIHWTRGWVASKFGMDILERRKSFSATRIQTLSSPATSLVPIPMLLLRL